MFTRYFLLSLFLILPIKIIAQVPLAGGKNADHNSLPYGERINIPSKFLNKDGIFDVYLPKGFKQDSDTTKYPLIITMDGWVLSQTVSGISSHLMNTAALPNSVVVALHTDVWSMLPKSYVHSTDNWPAESSSKLALAFKNNPPNAAEPFWQFLEKELIPFLESNYRTNDFRVFVGMSPTAFMGLHTMLKGPDLFRAYILVAATDVLGLGYTRDSSFVDEIVQAAASGALNNEYLYVASAKFESRREPRHEINAQSLRQGLVQYMDKMEFKIEHIDHFGHYPVAIPAITNGLNLIFPRKDFQMFQKLDVSPRQTIPKIVKHYNKLSKRYGVTINIPTDITRNPNSLRSIGYKLLKRQEYDQASEAFTLWTQISDKDPNAHFWLSRVFAAKGDLKEAIVSLEKSIALSRDFTPNNTSYFKNVLEKYKTQLNDD